MLNLLGPGPTSGSVSGGNKNITASSDVPAAPKNTAVGGKASLQPKRTPVSDKEIESIMVIVNIIHFFFVTT